MIIVRNDPLLHLLVLCIRRLIAIVLWMRRVVPVVIDGSHGLTSSLLIHMITVIKVVDFGLLHRPPWWSSWQMLWQREYEPTMCHWFVIRSTIALYIRGGITGRDS